MFFKKYSEIKAIVVKREHGPLSPQEMKQIVDDLHEKEGGTWHYNRITNWSAEEYALEFVREEETNT